MNQKLLTLEYVVGFGSSIAFMILIFAASFAVKNTIWQIVMIVSAIIIFAVGMYFSLKIEREAGYYECKKCGHKHVPTWSSHMLARHFGRTR